MKAAHEFLKSKFPSLPPVTSLIVTHAHWDHIGGHTYLKSLDPNLKIYGRANFEGTVERAQRKHSYRQFRGAEFKHDWIESYRPDIAIRERTRITIGGTEIELIPVTGGETEDAMFAYATGGIYARRHPNLSPVVMAAGQLVIGSAILIPLSLIADAPWTLQPSTVAIGSLITVALFSTAVPSLLLFWLVRNAGATNASLLAFFMLVAAVLLGVGLLGEQLSWSAIAGFGSIILGATIVTGNIPVPRLQSS